MTPGSAASATGPSHSALPPRTTRRPAIATSVTAFFSPGSNRTALPAGTLSRMPYDAARSNDSCALASMKW
jgi:hypothetical protein